MIFELEPGEKQLMQHGVQLVDERRAYPATLILTSRRAVVTYAKTPRPWVWVWLWMVALVMKAAAHAREQMRYQMRRERFVSVEEGDGGILVFHDSGEGYGHTSFAIKSHQSHAHWHALMQRWATGADEHGEGDGPGEALDDVVALPAARVVDR